MTGTVLGQGIALLLSPIITRLFALEDFSAFEQYSFLLSVLSVVICGKYEYSIMQPKEEEDARHLLALSIRIAFYASLTLLVVLFFTSSKLAAYYAYPPFRYLLWSLPFAVFLAGVFNALNYWFSRKKNYKVAALSKFLYSAVGEPFKLVNGFISPSSYGLILSTLVGHLTATGQAWKQFIKDQPKKLGQLQSYKLRELARAYNNYPRYALWGSILNNLAQWAHVAIFGYYYGSAAIIPMAYIALCRRVFFNPLGILASAYGQVFYQRIEQIESAIKLKQFYLHNFFRFALFAAVMILVVHLLPSQTLGFVFGKNWTDALEYLRILSYWYGFNFVLSSLSFIFNRLQLQRYTLVSDIVHFMAVLLCFFLAKLNDMTPFEAVQCMVVTKVAYLSLNLIAVIYYLNRNIRIEPKL
jgi:O-antigen/teichoic acid export membrane protein